MKNYLTGILIAILVVITFSALYFYTANQKTDKNVLAESTSVPTQQLDYWMRLERKSKQEYLYLGVAGDVSKSTLVKQFQVNVGVINERPTPLPQLMGKPYWNIIAKYEVQDDPETAPYFLTLDIPWSDEYPFGPTPYNECDGKQCDWVRPGSFGLHGIAQTPEKLTDAGSSGCIRHRDEDITYLYNLLSPSEQTPVKYYIEDL